MGGGMRRWILVLDHLEGEAVQLQVCGAPTDGWATAAEAEKDAKRWGFTAARAIPTRTFETREGNPFLWAVKDRR